MKTLFTLLIIVYSTFSLYSQLEISGSILDNNQAPIVYADVVLKSQDGNSILAHTSSDDQGKFKFSQNKGNYQLEISYLGYQKYTQNISLLENNIVLDIPLIEDVQAINEVTVNAERLAIERKIDRTVINIKNATSLAGNSILSVLEKSPGLTVNRQSGSISMSGKEGVVVMINNKIQYLQGNALLDFLNGLSSEKVDKLELLTTPPANLDAEGNAGFINIVMSRNENEGTSGNFSLVAGGYKGINTGADVGVNYKNKNFSSFVSLGFLYNSQSQDFRFFRDIYEQSIVTSHQTINDRRPKRTNGNSILGLEYKLNKTTFSTTFNGYRNNWDMVSINTSNIFRNDVKSENILSNVTEINLWKHFGVNAGIQHTINKTSSLSLNADLLYYKTENPSTYDNTSFLSSTNITTSSKIKSEKETPINIKVAKLDYTNELSSNFSIEAGVKGSLSGFLNDVSVSNLLNEKWVFDPNFTSIANLDESILAAYNSIYYKVNEKISFKGGLRYEYTHTHIKNEDETTILERKYGDLFPSLFFNYAINQNSSFGLSYSARITRPTFNNLAPFVIFTDPNSFTTGNTNLLPTKSKTIKAEWKRNALFVSLQYAKEENIIAMFIPKASGQNTTIYQTRNFDQNNVISTTISYPFTITKKWNTIFNCTGNVQQIKGEYNEKPVTINQKFATLFMINKFSFPAKINFEMTSMLNTGGIWGAYRNKPFGFLNLGLQKQLQSGASIILSFDNVLNTMLFRSNFTDDKTGNSFNNRMIFARPTASMTFRKSFGNKKVNTSKSLKSDERSRVE